MSIKIMGKSEIEYSKMEAELKVMEKLQEDLVNQIKISMGDLVNLDYLYELQEYIEDLIVDWEDAEFELEDDD